MPTEEMRHGFPETAWRAAKDEARAIMIQRAMIRGMIPYSDLVREIKSIEFDAHDSRFFNLLGEISSEEDSQARGMLTVVVVHKHGDMQPGPGFFELAARMGRDTSDQMKCWVDELHKVHAVWSKTSR